MSNAATVMATMISSRVKPLFFIFVAIVSTYKGPLLPVANIRVITFATGAAVGAIGHNVNLGLVAGIAVNIIGIQGVLGNFVAPEIRAITGGGAWVSSQCLQ